VLAVAVALVISPATSGAQDVPTTTTSTSVVDTVPTSTTTTTTVLPQTTTEMPTTSLPVVIKDLPPVVIPPGPVDGSTPDAPGTLPPSPPMTPGAILPGPSGVPRDLGAVLALRAPTDRKIAADIAALNTANDALTSATSDLAAANAAVDATGGAVDALGASDRGAANTAAETRKSLRDASIAAYVTGLGRNDLAVGLSADGMSQSMARVTYFHSINDNLGRIVARWNLEKSKLDPQAKVASDRHGLALARAESATAAQQATSTLVAAAQAALTQDQALAGMAPSVVAGIPDRVLDAYVRAAQLSAVEEPACRIRWWDLAAIGRTESTNASGRAIGIDGKISPPIIGPALNGAGFALIRDTDHGLWDGDTTYDHAVGPMQFIPSSWRSLGVDASGDGIADPQNIYDAAFSAARYLCAAAGPLPLDTEAGFLHAAYSYNHSTAYTLTAWQNSAPYRWASQAAQ
jgi:hypothetical protein